MIKNKKEYKPYPVKDWDHLIILLEDYYGKDYGLTPTEALECISKHYKKKDTSGYYWKLMRVNLYLKQRFLDTREGWIKFGKGKSTFKNFEKMKKNFKKCCGKKNKRIDTVRRTVESEIYAEKFKIFNRHRIEALKQLSADKEKKTNRLWIRSFNLLKGEHLDREIKQLNKLICSKKENDLFDKKHHQTKKGLFNNQTVINLLR